MTSLTWINITGKIWKHYQLSFIFVNNLSQSQPRQILKKELGIAD